MFQLGKTLISEDIIEKEFVCNLSACKGECCISGDAGAPLEQKETSILEDIYEDVKPYLRQEGIDSIEKQGTWVKGDWGDDLETPLIDGKECAYLVFDDNNMALCGIEKAYRDGKVSWRKPVSCYLYPIRIKNFGEMSALNYDRWDICDDACTLGRELKVPIYKFLKDPLIERFGKHWYEELEIVAEEYSK